MGRGVVGWQPVWSREVEIKWNPCSLERNIFIWFPFFRFLGNDISDNRYGPSIVRLDGKSVARVKFFQNKKPLKLLCEMPMLKAQAAPEVQIESFSKYSFKNNIQLSLESNSRLHWFYFTSLCYWSRKVVPISQLIRCKTKRNHILVFPRFWQIGWFCFEFWMPVVTTLV